jgi:hypothetical protein
MTSSLTPFGVGAPHGWQRTNHLFSDRNYSRLASALPSPVTREGASSCRPLSPGSLHASGAITERIFDLKGGVHSGFQGLSGGSPLILIGVIATASNRETVGRRLGGPIKMMNGLFWGMSWGRQSSDPVRSTVRICVYWSSHGPGTWSIAIDPKRVFTHRVTGGGIHFWSSLLRVSPGRTNGAGDGWSGGIPWAMPVPP